MPFSQQSIDFLFENRLHDSKSWFTEHKADYDSLVKQPMAQLVLDLAPTMMKIDKYIICDPKKISRIYRDARMHPDSIFRDHIWYSFGRPRDARNPAPEFYFSIGSGGMSFGCGYYCARPAVMQAVRELILSDDDSFKAAFLAVKKQKSFQLFGEPYKRNRYPDQPPEKCDWLNRRGLGLSSELTDPEIMFTDKLAKHIAREFKKIAPVYDLYMKAELLAAQAE
ncbi:MAG: DUF2461 domain-containing protein [Ruminococcaceae bacterium]|nr:DUF2461 domain-containing protein [Oscillospiraceae bacterium]